MTSWRGLLDSLNEKHGIVGEYKYLIDEKRTVFHILSLRMEDPLPESFLKDLTDAEFRVTTCTVLHTSLQPGSEPFSYNVWLIEHGNLSKV